jgi:alanine dehydrogenase
MNIGVPREVMDNEFRVGMVPAGVLTLTRAGHGVLVEKSAGAGSGISDQEYVDAGATILGSAAEVFARAEMIVKVKEPLPSEFAQFREGQVLFTFLHLAPRPELTDFLCRQRICAIAYETIELDSGLLPVLAPMSEVAGRMSIQVGAHFLEKVGGGSGVLLAGVPGVEHGRVTVIGGGVVGSNAVRMAQAMGAEVTVLDRNMHRLEHLDQLYAGRINTLVANEYNIRRAVQNSDLLVGAVLVTGSSAPKLVSREMVASMRPGSVIVDVAIDQGGCVETARVTTHSRPVYEVDGIIHYCVANMPGGVPRTSTFALTNVTMNYTLDIANKGVVRAMRENEPLRRGLNVYEGVITHREVAVSQGKEWQAFS